LEAAQYIYDIPSNNCVNAKNIEEKKEQRIPKRLTNCSGPTSKKIHPEIRGDQWNRTYKGSPCAYLTKPNTIFSVSSRTIKWDRKIAAHKMKSRKLIVTDDAEHNITEPLNISEEFENSKDKQSSAEPKIILSDEPKIDVDFYKASDHKDKSKFRLLEFDYKISTQKLNFPHPLSNPSNESMKQLWMMTVSRNVHKFLYSIIKILEKSKTKKLLRLITQT
jgi:hypothetical protein